MPERLSAVPLSSIKKCIKFCKNKIAPYISATFEKNDTNYKIEII